MTLIIIGYLFVLGLMLGSFTLAMVDRMYAKKDWVRGRSQCDYCGHKLGVIDLIPLYSWSVAGGKCQYCRKKLSPSYPLAELGMGLAFAVSYIFYPYALSGTGAVLFGLWLFSLILLGALFIYDWRWFLLPNKLVYPLIMVGLVHRMVYITSSSKTISELAAGLAGSLLLGAGVFLVLHVVSSGKWIGDGDVRFAVAMGLFLPGPLEVWLAVFTASVLGIISVLPQLKKHKKGLKSKIPFGPMLIAGLLVAYLFGGQLVDWYSNTFLYL
jgi:prepilin signal peptidase PulO-like enzyme (type II secretory pathway)